MAFSLALFVPTDETILEYINEVIAGLSPEHQVKQTTIITEVSRAYTCMENLPRVFIGMDRIWHEWDKVAEKPAMRLVKKRMKFIAEERNEAAQLYDEEIASARVLVRIAMWEADHPFPLTPWRLLWRQALLDHACCSVVYLACEQVEE